MAAGPRPRRAWRSRQHPLMVLSSPPRAPTLPLGITVRVVAPEDTELDRIWAVPAVAFGHPGTATGEAGPAERDKIAADHDGGTIAMLRERVRSGHSVLAAAFGPDGPLGAEAARRSTASRKSPAWACCHPPAAGASARPSPALLARDALDRGVETVFLSPATTRWPASMPGSASARSASP